MVLSVRFAYVICNQLQIVKQFQTKGVKYAEDEWQDGKDSKYRMSIKLILLFAVYIIYNYLQNESFPL